MIRESSTSRTQATMCEVSNSHMFILFIYLFNFFLFFLRVSVSLVLGSSPRVDSSIKIRDKFQIY